MEESFSWKSIFFGVFFSLLVLAVAYWLIAPRDYTFFTQDKSDRLAEFHQTRVVGRQDGQTVWELNAGSGWTDKAQEITYLTDVRQGKLYNKKGQLVLHGLRAPSARAWRHSEIVEATGGVNAYLDIGKFTREPKKEADWLRMTGAVIKYLPAEKRSELAGKITLAQHDSVIRAGRVAIDHERKSANLQGNIRLTRRDSDIVAETLEYFGETEALKAAGRITLRLKESRTRTLIKCDRADLSVDLDRDIDLAGNVEVTQGKKLSLAGAGTYSRRRQQLLLRDGTRTVLEKAANEIKPETARQLDSPEQKRLLRQKTVIAAREMVFSLKTGDARATGSVEVTQQGREARSDSAFYDDKLETLALSGNVYLKRGEEWLSCRQVIISVKNETFEARGVQEAKFNL
ncbi:MAG: hypothetical protein WC529_07655 [Candidatus Margulisiibacteriota bacterium]